MCTYAQILRYAKQNHLSNSVKQEKIFSSFIILNLITICKSWGSCNISNSFTSFFQLSRRFVTNFWGNGFVWKNLVPDVALKKFALSIFHTLSVNSYVFSNRAFVKTSQNHWLLSSQKNCYENTIFLIIILFYFSLFFVFPNFRFYQYLSADDVRLKQKGQRIQKMWRRLKIRDEKETNTTKKSVTKTTKK